MGLSYNPVKGEYENGTSLWSVTRITPTTPDALTGVVVGTIPPGGSLAVWQIDGLEDFDGTNPYVMLGTVAFPDLFDNGTSVASADDPTGDDPAIGSPLNSSNFAGTNVSPDPVDVIATFYKFGGGDPESTTGAFLISLLISPAPSV